MKVGIGIVHHSFVPRTFTREPVSSRILGAKLGSESGNVGNMEIVISAEGRRMATHSTPVEKLQPGPTSALA